MSLITFLIAAIVLAVTPGPGIAYVVARTVAGGRTEGLASCLGTGIGPTALEDVILVCKAYTTRVGAGVFPTECSDENGEAMRRRGVEFGTTTGRPRRCGWLDGPVLRSAALLNGATALAVTKLDVLDEFPVIPVCVGYRIEGRQVNTVPAWPADLEQAEPIYEELEGWQQPISEARSWPDLPAQAQAYLQRMADLAQVPITLVSVGHGREQTVRC